MSDPSCTIVRQCCDEPTVIVSNKGEKGDTGPPGPAGSLTGPNPVTDEAIPIWDGTVGNLLKDSGVKVSELATVAALANKVDLVAGKGLSEEDFTTVLKAKLDAITSGAFRGTYADLLTLQAAVPVGDEGDYAYVVTAPDAQATYAWDNVNSVWSTLSALTGAEISALLFAELDTNNLTDSLLGKINNAATSTELSDAVAAVSALLDDTTNNVLDEPTTARTLALADAGKFLTLTNVGGCTITLPTDVVAGWVDNTQISFFIQEAVLPSFLSTGVTILGEANLAGYSQNDTFFIKRIAPDVWVLGFGK